MSDTDSIFGECVYRYTRAEAIDDGVLVDVSTTAREAGFRWPVAITSAVWEMVKPSKEVAHHFGCDIDGRLWDLLWMAFVAIKSAKNGTILHFRVIMPQTKFQSSSSSAIQTFKLHSGPDDDGRGCITIMLPDED